MTAPEDPPASVLAGAPMHRAQILVVALCVLLNALDGFDVLAVTFAAPGISTDWSISRTALGVVISAGLAGMAAGSLILAPLADRIGRRPLILFCLATMAAGMVMTATAGSIVMLSLWRIVTGLGIGGMIASINAMASEFASEKRRDLAVSLMSIGYPIGGMLGGLASAGLIEIAGWRAIFVFGGLATALCLPLIWFGMPESLEFLAGRRGRGALAGYNRVLARLGHATVAVLPGATAARAGARFRDLLAPAYFGLTAMLVAAYFLHIMTFYFYSGWLPKLMTDRGFTVADAIVTSSIMSIGGIIGGTAIGWLAPAIGLKRLLLGSLVATSVLMGVFGLMPPVLAAMRVVAFFLGMGIFGGIVGLYAFLARGFPTYLRATGSGLAIGLGRGGAVVGPILGGVLLDAGFRSGSVLTVIGLGAALAALVLLPIRLGAPLRIAKPAPPARSPVPH